MILLATSLVAVLAFTASLSGAERQDKSHFWTFKPGAKPPIPQVQARTWARNPIDLFILAKLEEKRIQPSAEADRRTLIRRVAFDLTGLPPEPREVQEFLHDTQPSAYERLVDRLLASPRYGERWGRHWLDVVHFGETHGYDKDKLRPHAWPYRDYVIRALNQDKPYARFIQEQLAGDVLFPGSPDGVVATGFIAAGPWDYVGHVELPESKTDGLIARYNDRDDMVMTTMSTFQSLTVHCARCHDHKFDPITQRDYYSLQAVFAGVDRANRSYDRDPILHHKRQQFLTEKKQLEQEKAELDNKIAKLISPDLQRLIVRGETLKAELGEGVSLPKKPKTLGYHSKISPSSDIEKWVQVDLGETRLIDKIALVPAYEIYAGHPGPAFGFPARFRIDLADDTGFDQPVTVASQTEADFPSPGNVPYTTTLFGKKARFVRVTATKLWRRTDDWIFALGELVVLSGGTNIARHAKVTALDSIEAAPNWGAKCLVDEISVLAIAGSPGDGSSGLARHEELLAELRRVEFQSKGLRDALINPELRAALDHNKARTTAVKSELAALPPSQLVYAAAHEFAPEGSFKPAAPIRPVHLLARGDVKRPKEIMVPGTLTVFSNAPAPFALSDASDEGKRRIALAAWLAHTNNLLTRRSIVNRVWQYHFGRGIVETPNDFGHMGAQPTHPELLDWLAFWFMEQGESLKALHRLILTSAAYRQSSQGNSEYAKIDSDNRLLWRMNRTRLEAEAIRDAMLAVSGNLDLAMGGPSIQQFYFKDDHSPIYDYTRFDVDSPGARRRAVYRHIVRSVPDPFMDCLDAADPSLLTARRNTTLTALQALATLNNPFVIHQAERFAERLQHSSDNTTSQIRLACALAFSRAPTAAEINDLEAHIQKHGLASACRVLFNSNEFLFID